jgi:hypothetical protein
MTPQSGAPRVLPATYNSKLSSLNISPTSLIIPHVPPLQNQHNFLNIELIPFLIHPHKEKFFDNCPLRHNPTVQQIGNYTIADLADWYKNINVHVRSMYCFHPIKTKRRPLYLKTQSVPRCKHF